MNASSELQIEHVPVDSLHRDAANPRRISDAELEAFTRSIREFGFVALVIARREDGTVVGGHQRLVAATVPKDTIFEALSLVKRAVHEGKIRKSRGALLVAIVKRACADRGVLVSESRVTSRGLGARPLSQGNLSESGETPDLGPQGRRTSNPLLSPLAAPAP